MRPPTSTEPCDAHATEDWEPGDRCMDCTIATHADADAAGMRTTVLVRKRTADPPRRSLHVMHDPMHADADADAVDAPLRVSAQPTCCCARRGGRCTGCTTAIARRGRRRLRARFYRPRKYFLVSYCIYGIVPRSVRQLECFFHFP